MPDPTKAYVLKDVPSNPDEAVVDDITLEKGGDSQSLTEDQFKRLKDAGVKLDEESKTAGSTGTGGDS